MSGWHQNAIDFLTICAIMRAFNSSIFIAVKMARKGSSSRLCLCSGDFADLAGWREDYDRISGDFADFMNWREDYD